MFNQADSRLLKENRMQGNDINYLINFFISKDIRISSVKWEQCVQDWPNNINRQLFKRAQKRADLNWKPPKERDTRRSQVDNVKINYLNYGEKVSTNLVSLIDFKACLRF
jgi:hypothetical protein